MVCLLEIAEFVIHFAQCIANVLELEVVAVATCAGAHVHNATFVYAKRHHGCFAGFAGVFAHQFLVAMRAKKLTDFAFNSLKRASVFCTAVIRAKVYCALLAATYNV